MPFSANTNYWKQLQTRPSLKKSSTLPEFGRAALKGGRINGGRLS